MHWSESLGAWVVTRYADVLEIWNRPDLFSSDRFRKVGAEFTSQRPEVRAVASVLSEWLVFRDPPDHTRLRALLQKTFTPRQLASSRAQIQAAIDALIDERARASARSTSCREFAFPLPALVIALLLGAPSERHRGDQALVRRARGLPRRLARRPRQLHARARRRGGAGRLLHAISCARSAASPGEDLIGLMLRAEHEGHTLGSEEIVSNCVLLLFAGHETTTNLLANGLFHLLRDPDSLAQLRARPELDATAVEELLRIESPVPATVKIATRDVEFRGAQLRAGEMVLPFLSSANRDPRQFRDPDRSTSRARRTAISRSAGASTSASERRSRGSRRRSRFAACSSACPELALADARSALAPVAVLPRARGAAGEVVTIAATGGLRRFALPRR